MARKKQEIVTVEWSVPVEAADISASPRTFTISPDADAIKRLMRRLDLLSLTSLKANVVLTRDKMVVHAQGHFDATLEQRCVVTMDPVPVTISEDFEAWFADAGQAVSLTKVRHDRNSHKGEKPILEEHEDPEAIIDGLIDIGELTTQYLSLALDPYPRTEGAHYEIGDDVEKSTESSEIRKNPFAALKDWKARKE